MATINVWHDRTSEPGDSAWVVSIEDERGSRTLHSFEGRSEAVACGTSEASSRGLPLQVE